MATFFRIFSPSRAAWLVALLVVPGLILWGAGRDDPRVGAAQPVRDWVAGYLYADHQFGQIIQPAPRDLVGVRLWLPRPVAPGAGVLRLSVHPLDRAEELASAALPVAALPARGPAVFRFDPLPLDRLGQTKPAPLVLTLRAEGIDRASAVSVLAGPNAYPNGTLLRDGRTISRADLAFELLYRSSWLDQLLPVTQIARSRPGLLGWPPLYALLLYAMLVALALFARRAALALRAPAAHQGG